MPVDRVEEMQEGVPSEPGCEVSRAIGAGTNVTRILQRLLDGVVLGLGAWTLYCYILGFLGADNRLLLCWAFLPFVLALVVFLRLPGRVGEPVAGPDLQQVGFPRLIIGACAAVAVVGVFLFTGNYLVFWILAVVMLVLGFRLRPHEPTAALISETSERAGVIVFLCLLAFVVTLAAHRPDADDSLYLSLVVGALDHPEQQVMRYDDMYGEPDLPLVEAAYRLKSYELLIASLNHWFKIPPKALYYLFFPALFAVLAVAAHWLALREIGGSFAWVGAVTAVIALMVWGDTHPAMGNFAFVRLFQGKAVLVSVFVPAVILYASRFAREQTWNNWLLLGAVQTAALGLTPSAVIVAPLAGGAFLLAAAPESGGPKLFVRALLASTLVVVAGAFILAVMPIEGSVPTSTAEVWSLVESAGGGLDYVLGLPARKAAALLALFLLPFLAPGGRRGAILQRYILILLLVVMNPLLPGTLGIVTARFTWRVFWAVPFPLLIGLLAQRIAAGAASQRPVARIGGAATVGIVFALMPGTGTLSENNETRLGFPGFKVNRGYAVARSIVDQTSTEDLVLAPYEVALWIPSFSNHPRLVGVRPNYLHVLGVKGWDEVQNRRILMRLVTHGWFPHGNVKAAAEVIERRGVSLVVLPSELPQRDRLAAYLEDMGCRPEVLSCSQGVRPYEAWRCLAP